MITRRPFIVAELSANHGGRLARAMHLVEAAAEAGADAVKLQTFSHQQMVKPEKRIEGGPWDGRLAIGLYIEAHTPREWHEPLFNLAHRLGMVAFSSVFHPDDIAFLETIACPIYKIASFELTDLVLIERAARTGKPLIISTGMGTSEEIGNAAYAACESGCTDLTLLKCSSAYPAPVEELNLRAMQYLTTFPRCTAYGFSDHTVGNACAIAATALGAQMIEKHLKLDNGDDSSPDAAFSATPCEFARLVTGCRQAAAALGENTFGPTLAEGPSQQLRRPSGGYRGELNVAS